MMSTAPNLRTFLRFLTARSTRLISAPLSRGLMSIVANVITPQGLEPFQIPTKIRSPSLRTPQVCKKLGIREQTSSFSAAELGGPWGRSVVDSGAAS